MPKSSTPATELQDAVSSAVAAFMKAANHALASVEEANKEEIRHVQQEVRDVQRERDEIRRERDALVKEKADSAIELEAARSETQRWRAAAEKAEWMINHQGESIAQLRLEAQQWKDQFMRIDDERLRLSARNDELVSQQLYAAHRRDAYYLAQEPLTPRSQGPPQAQGSSSTRAASSNQFTSSSIPASGYVTDGAVLSRRSARDESYPRQQARARGGRNASAAHAKGHAQSTASSTLHASQSQNVSAPTQSKVLRTVHVVMQGAPVKEESIDSVTLNSAASHSESLGDEDELELEEEVERRPMQAKAQRRDSGKGKQKAVVQPQNARRRWSEGRRVYDEDSESGSASPSEDDGDDYVPSPIKPAARLDDVDEDEDELMLGGEADRRAQKKLVSDLRTPARRAQTQPTRQANSSSGTVRKRNSPYPTNATGKKARNR